MVTCKYCCAKEVVKDGIVKEKQSKDISVKTTQEHFEQEIVA
jgi:hypothetical protein